MQPYVQLLVLALVLYDTSAALICPGYCTSESECLRVSGGGALGVCFDSQFCCMPAEKDLHKCGAVRTDLQDNHYFASPSFPATSSGDLLCTFSMKLKKGVVKITPTLLDSRIDFLTFSSDGVTYSERSPTCDSDHLFIQGLHGFMPQSYCGNLSGYQLLIDDHATVSMQNLTLIAVMSSKAYRWLIAIQQFTSLTCENSEYITEASLTASSRVTSSPSSTNSPVTAVTKPTTTVRYNRDAYGPVGLSVNHHRNLLIDNEEYQGPGQVLPMIINGEDAHAGKFPWQVSVRINLSLFPTSIVANYTQPGCDIKEGHHICGGSIISETEILTAAHCFHPSHKLIGRLPPWMFKIVVGDINKCKDVDKNGRRKRNLAVQEFRVAKIILHYDNGLETGNFNDVAVVKIFGKIKLGKNVQTIVMADPDSDYEGRNVIVSGWGKTHSFSDPLDPGSDILQFNRDMHVTSRASAKKHILGLMGLRDDKNLDRRYNHVTRSFICISSTDKNSNASSGQGDSGGPVVVYEGKNNPKPILVGIISMVLIPPDRKRANPVNYLTNVAYYRNWIDTATCA